MILSVDTLCLQAIHNEARFLGELYRVLKLGGILLLRVPAHPWLLSNHEKYTDIHRRYTKGNLTEAINKANFNIHKISYMNSLLFVPQALRSLKHHLVPTAVHSPSDGIPGWLNRIMINTLAAERFILERTDMFIGNGLLVIAEKTRH